MISLLHQAPLCWLKYEDVLPRFRPGRSTRECHVHKCDVEKSSAKKSSRKRGHMEPMGSQQSDMTEVERVTLHDPGEFYEKYVAGAAPVILAGAATAATSGVHWTDDFLYSLCQDLAVWRGRLAETACSTACLAVKKGKGDVGSENRKECC